MHICIVLTRRPARRAFEPLAVVSSCGLITCKKLLLTLSMMNTRHGHREKSTRLKIKDDYNESLSTNQTSLLDKLSSMICSDRINATMRFLKNAQ
jgi:hypothetical protein